MQALTRQSTLNAIIFAIIFVFIFTLVGGVAWAGSGNSQLQNYEISSQSIFPADSDEQQAPGRSPGEARPQSFLKGSLLGNLFLGHPFERASLVDITALLFLAFVITKLISRSSSGKRSGQDGFFGRQSQDDDSYNPDEEKKSGPAAPPQGFDPWARLQSKQDKKLKAGKTIPFPDTTQAPQKPIPEAYSEESFQIQTETSSEGDEFLEGAKLIYVRLQEAWKTQDLDFIEHFTSPSIYQHFLETDKNDYKDIVKVNARVLEESKRNGDPFIIVEFTGLAHKSKHSGPPSEIKEVWAFLEPSNTGTWRLEEMR